jgi:hypothetical protein
MMKRGGFGSMKQNKYDDTAFFASYSQMARSIGGLDAAGEWPAFYANELIKAGFTIIKLSEPQPTKAMLEQHPEWQDETRRPMFLLIAAIKHGSGKVQ